MGVQQQHQQQEERERKPEPYACLIIEGSDQSRGWFQSLLLSHAGVREALRRQRPQERPPGAPQSGGRMNQHPATTEAGEAEAPTATAGSGGDKQGPEEEKLLEGWDVPLLPFNTVVTHGFVVDSSVRAPHLLLLMLFYLLFLLLLARLLISLAYSEKQTSCMRCFRGTNSASPKALPSRLPSSSPPRDKQQQQQPQQ